MNILFVLLEMSSSNLEKIRNIFNDVACHQYFQGIWIIFDVKGFVRSLRID